MENPIKMDDLGSFQSLEVLLRKAGAESETEMIEARTDFMGLSAVKVGRVNRVFYGLVNRGHPGPRTQGL